MRNRHFVLAAIVATSLLFLSTRAHALENSTRKPFYIQGIVLGFAWEPAVGGAAWYHQDVEFGYHTTGRHVEKGLCVLVRPAETTGAEFVDAGTVFFHFDSGAGLGFAF